MTPTRDEEDERLMARIRDNDEEALHCLLRKYHATLCRLSYSVLRNRALAEEAVSDVFLNLWNLRATAVIRTCVFHYLHRAVTNQSRNLREKNGNAANVVPLDEINPDLLAESESADGSLLLSELRIAIEAMIAHMPPQRQKVFRMNRLEGKRYKQIASELGLSVNTVQKHMVLAMSQIAGNLPAVRNLLAKHSRTD